MKLVATAAAALIAILSYSGKARAQPITQPAAKKVTLKQLAAQVAALQATVSSLQNQLASQNAQNAFALGQFVTVDTQRQINGVPPPHIIVTGANLHVRSGSGTTIDDTHLGNLVIGYDSDSGNAIQGGCLGGTPADIDLQREGSHNLIIGDCHEFTSSGGLIAGFDNQILSNSASVSGGRINQASGDFSTVSGGLSNQASGDNSSVTGGNFNQATAESSSVSGGQGNQATGSFSSVSGGAGNHANGLASSIGGGLNQTENSDNANIN
jgi:hypothetical protein